MRYEFNTRNEAIEFLDKYNFEKFVPFDNAKYYVEIENNEVSFCSLCFYSNSFLYNQIPFYDKDRPNDFISKEEGEKFYQEYQEASSYIEDLYKK